MIQHFLSYPTFGYEDHLRDTKDANEFLCIINTIKQEIYEYWRERKSFKVRSVFSTQPTDVKASRLS